MNVDRRVHLATARPRFQRSGPPPLPHSGSPLEGDQHINPSRSFAISGDSQPSPKPTAAFDSAYLLESAALAYAARSASYTVPFPLPHTT